MDILVPSFYCFLGCIGFCIIFNIRGKLMFYAALGGGLSWLIYLLLGYLENDITQSFLAIIAVSLYSEIMARVHKVPVTIYSILALLPLVPGRGIYNTMRYGLDGDIPAFVESFIHTLGIAGALALGVLVVSSLFHLWNKAVLFKRMKKDESLS